MSSLKCPILDAKQVLDHSFLEMRAKLIEIAATLDRVGRAAGDVPAEDARLVFVRQSLQILLGDAPNRAELIQLLYSLK